MPDQKDTCEKQPLPGYVERDTDTTDQIPETADMGLSSDTGSTGETGDTPQTEPVDQDGQNEQAETQETQSQSGDEGVDQEIELERMTKAELEDYADTIGLQLNPSMKKAEMIAAIEDKLTAGDEEVDLV